MAGRNFFCSTTTVSSARCEVVMVDGGRQLLVAYGPPVESIERAAGQERIGCERLRSKGKSISRCEEEIDVPTRKAFG